MIWKEGKPKSKLEDGKIYTDLVLLLLPQRVEGYWVWFERVERKRKWWEFNNKNGHWSQEFGEELYLTQSQKEKLGLTW